MPAAGQNGAEVLTIQTAVDRAVNASLKAKEAQYDLNAEEARKHEAWADIGPQASLSYTDVRFPNKLTTQFGPQTIVLRDSESNTGSLSVTQPLTGLYALIERSRLESLQTTMKDNALKLAEVDSAFSAADLYRRAQAAREMVTIAKSSLDANQSQVSDAQALYRAGKLTKADLLKLQLAVLDAKTEIAKAQAQEAAAFTAMHEALGLPTDAPLELSPLPSAASVDVDHLNPVPSYQEALQDAYDHRLEAKQATLGTRAAEFGKEVVYARFSPNVGVFAKVDHNFGQVPALGGEKTTRSWGINATWDIWDNGSRLFALSEADAGVRKAETQVLELKQGIRLEVEQLIANLVAAREALTLAKAAIAQAEEAYRIEAARFHSGASTTTDLLLAEAAQTKARGGFVAALTDYDTQWMKLERAMGGARPKLD